jgi:hypothetical protein
MSVPHIIMTAQIIRDEHNKGGDDFIRVRRVDNNVVVYYKDSTSTRTQELILTNTSLGLYLKNLCFLLRTDEKPFEAIQFNFHGLPTCWISTCNLNQKAVNNLMEMASISVDSAFADSPRDMYDDMPPLVPLRSGGWDDDSEPFERHY